MIGSLMLLAHAGHFLIAIPFLMPVVLLGGGLAFMVVRDRIS